MRAASAKAVSFFDASVLSDIIFVKFTNCTRINEKTRQNTYSTHLVQILHRDDTSHMNKVVFGIEVLAHGRFQHRDVNLVLFWLKRFLPVKKTR